MTSNALMVKRIRDQMKKTGIGARELAERAEVGRSFVYDVLSGKSSNPTTKKIAAVAGVLGVSVPYLLDENADPELLNPDHVKIPIITNFAEIDRALVEEKKDQFFYFQKDFIANFNAVPADLRIVKVEGDCMAPTLCHNDTLLVDLTRKLPTPPGVFVVFDGIGLTIKRIEFVSGAESPTLNICSDNSRYSSYIAKVADCRIIGRVIWFGRNL